jgi:hypothetical protein
VFGFPRKEINQKVGANICNFNKETRKIDTKINFVVMFAKNNKQWPDERKKLSRKFRDGQDDQEKNI